MTQERAWTEEDVQSVEDCVVMPFWKASGSRHLDPELTCKVLVENGWAPPSDTSRAEMAELLERWLDYADSFPDRVSDSGAIDMTRALLLKLRGDDNG